MGVNKKDFENILESLSNFSKRLRVPIEIIENNDALHVENNILRQALGIYEEEVSFNCFRF